MTDKRIDDWRGSMDWRTKDGRCRGCDVDTTTDDWWHELECLIAIGMRASDDFREQQRKLVLEIQARNSHGGWSWLRFEGPHLEIRIDRYSNNKGVLEITDERNEVIAGFEPYQWTAYRWVGPPPKPETSE